MRNKIIYALLVTFISCGTKEEKKLKKYKNEIIETTKSELSKPETFDLIEFKYVDKSENQAIRYIYSAQNSSGNKITRTVNYSLNTKGEIFYTSSKNYDIEYGKLKGKASLQNMLSIYPLTNASVKLINLDTLNHGSVYEGYTDEYGKFNFQQIVPGNYIISIIGKNSINTDEVESDLYLRKIYLLSMFKSIIYLDPYKYKLRYNIPNYSLLEKKYKELEDLKNDIQKGDDEITISLCYTAFQRIFPEYINMLPYQLIVDLDLNKVASYPSIIQPIRIESKMEIVEDFKYHM